MSREERHTGKGSGLKVGRKAAACTHTTRRAGSVTAQGEVPRRGEVENRVSHTSSQAGHWERVAALPPPPPGNPTSMPCNFLFQVQAECRQVPCMQLLWNSVGMCASSSSLSFSIPGTGRHRQHVAGIYIQKAGKYVCSEHTSSSSPSPLTRQASSRIIPTSMVGGNTSHHSPGCVWQACKLIASLHTVTSPASTHHHHMGRD